MEDLKVVDMENTEPEEEQEPQPEDNGGIIGRLMGGVLSKNTTLPQRPRDKRVIVT